MKIYFLLSIAFFFILSVYSCTPKQDFELITLKKPYVTITGFEDALYVLGVTTKQEVDSLSSKEEYGLSLSFDKNDILSSVTLKSKAYQTRRGVRVGSSKQEVKEKHGKPHAKNINISKSKKSIGSVDCLIYECAIFFFEKDKVSYIILNKI